MLTTYLKKKFGRGEETPGTEQFYSPLRIALHSTIKISLVDLLILKQSIHPNYGSPASPFSVQAIGTFVPEAGKTVFRFYISDTNHSEYILFLFVEDSSGEILESVLYKEVTNLSPTSKASWDKYTSAMGFETQELDGIVYNRLQGDRYTEKMEFLQFNETFVNRDGVKKFSNQYLLYGRDIENPVIPDEKATELLLCGIEEDDDKAAIVFQIGMPIPIQDINVL